jgi:hypothetical protein
MSNDIYPNNIRGLHHSLLRGPEFTTTGQQVASGAKTRLPRHRNPIWHWQVDYEYLKDMPDDLPDGLDYTDMRSFLDFFLTHRGRYDDFLLDDPDDHYVGPALIDTSPNLAARLQLTQDLVTGVWYSPIQRLFGGQFYEDIAELNGRITVYANGSETFEYRVIGPGVAISGNSFAGLCLQWDSKPAEPVTAEFYYYWRVRFEEDTQGVEKFLGSLLQERNDGMHVWAAGGSNARTSAGVKLVSVRPTSESGMHGVTSEYLEIPFEVLSGGISAIIDAPDIIWRRTMFCYNPTWFDEVEEIIIEAMAFNASGENYVVRILQDGGDDTYYICGTINIPPTEAGDTGWYRVGVNATGTPFVPGPFSSTKYIIQVHTDDSSVGMARLRLIHRQRSSLTRTICQYPLSVAGEGSDTRGIGGVVPLVSAVHDVTTSDETQGSDDGRHYNLFQYVPSRFDCDSLKLMVYGVGGIIWNTADRHFWMRLYDMGAVYEHARLKDPEHKVFEAFNECMGTWDVPDELTDFIPQMPSPTMVDAPYVFTDGHYYEGTVQSFPWIVVAKWYGGQVLLNPRGVRQLEICHQISRGIIAGGYGNTCIWIPRTATYVHEACGYAVSMPDTGVLRIVDCGEKYEDWYIETDIPVPVAESEVSFESSEKTIVRSEPFTLQGGRFYRAHNTYSPDSAVIVGQLLIEQLDLRTL